MAAEHPYADSSALIKLVLEEPESAALEEVVATFSGLLTSRVAAIEVIRAVRMENPELEPEADQLLGSCVQIAVTERIVELARRLTTARLRTLDALHLATALHTGARTVVAYDRRLAEAARAQGLRVLHPGLAA